MEQFGWNFTTFLCQWIPVSVYSTVASKATLFKLSLVPARLAFVNSDGEEYVMSVRTVWILT